MVKKILREQKIALQLIGLIAVFALAFWLARMVIDNEAATMLVERYGYFGAFILAIISGFNIVVPIPAVAFVPLFLEAGLDWNMLIGILAVATTIADLFAFFGGRIGRLMFQHQQAWHTIITQFIRMHERHWFAPLIALFVYASFTPLPNEVILIPMGFMGYRMRYIVLPLFLGNIVFHVLYGVSVLHVFTLF